MQTGDEGTEPRGVDSDGENGMVTVEIACGFIAVMLVLALVCSCIGVGFAQHNICRAVREGAREASMGGDGRGVAMSLYRGKEEVSISVTREGRWVKVQGEAPFWGPVGWGGGHAHCEVRTLVEQTVP